MINAFIAVIATSAFALLAAGSATATPAIKHVFVIVMENTDADQIYDRKDIAPYINNELIPNYARAMNFADPLPQLKSEPHYIWMEAGTNKLGNKVFDTDALPSATNSTPSSDHLVARIKASNTFTWMTYQQGIDAHTGECPIANHLKYAARHNPFVFFHDVSGNPPNKDEKVCKEHTKPYSAFAADLTANKMANYVFITPDLCNDMHGHDDLCPGDRTKQISAGDTWLSQELPRIIDWAKNNSGVIFIVWDESDTDNATIPFLAIGPGVRPGHASTVKYDHGSLVKSVEEIFGLQPPLETVKNNASFKDMFKPGSYP